mmetsp:Transcript_11689/g.23264  ORF Transcript_11689/g.23264 Transcript_11689/m.23264 type:complete len:267 (-) Transcript_11689:155-955(-)
MQPPYHTSFYENLRYMLDKGIKEAKDKGKPHLLCGCGRCTNPLTIDLSIERFEVEGFSGLPTYDTEGAAAAGRLTLVNPEDNGITNINSIPVSCKPHGFLTRAVRDAVNNVLSRLDVVKNARDEKEAGLPGDRLTARNRTARDKDTVLELEEHVKNGTLREHIKGQIEQLLKDDYEEWENDDYYYVCPHCEGKPWEKLDFGGPSVKLKRAHHTTNNPLQASLDHINTMFIDYRKVRKHLALLVPLFDRLHLINYYKTCRRTSGSCT